MRVGATSVTPATSASLEPTHVSDPWVTRVIHWELTGDTPPEHRLSWTINNHARTDLEQEVFGKRVLITAHSDWPLAEVVAAAG